jgi:hypothetical protein
MIWFGGVFINKTNQDYYRMNRKSDFAVFYNLKVHEHLEIDNAEVLLTKDLYKIKGLKKLDEKVAWMICSEFELMTFSNFYDLINNLKLTSGFLHFYHEVPIDLYQWIKNNSFKNILFESHAFLALQLLLYTEKDEIYEEQLIEKFYIEVHQIKEDLIKEVVTQNDNIKYEKLFECYHLDRLEKKEQINVLKYWKFIEDRLGRLPAEPFRKGYELEKLKSWGLMSGGNLDFHCKAYIVRNQHIKSFTKSRSMTRLDNNYKYYDTHLKTWKELIKGVYHVDEGDFEFIIKEYNKLDYKKGLLCKVCGKGLEFERNETELDISLDNDYLCSFCYLEKYCPR